MSALEELAAALAAYRQEAVDFGLAHSQNDPTRDALVAAVEAVVLAAEEDLLVELPPAPTFGEHELAEAYARRSVADPDDPEAKAVDVAVSVALADRRGGSYVANETRRNLRTAERALRDLTVGHARQLRELHAGRLPSFGSGLDQDRRDLARAVHLVEGLTNGLIAGAHFPLALAPEPEEPTVAPRRIVDRPQA